MLSFALPGSNIIYNYLYISNLYIISEIERTSEINCHNCNCHTSSLFYLFTFLPSYLFPYQALQPPEQFVGHAHGILGRAEAWAHLQRQEVQSERAVGAAGNRDVLAAEERRVALVGLQRQRLGEREVLVVAELVSVLVAAQHAGVLAAGLHHAVGAHQGLHVHAEVGVAAPAAVVQIFLVSHNNIRC